MMNTSINLHKNISNSIGCILIAILPISMLMGSAIINITVILINLVFLIDLTLNKRINYLNQKTFYALLIFWFTLLINSIFSTYFENSIFRILGFFRFIILVFAIKYYLSINNSYYEKIVFKIWTIIFLVVSIDLLFEFFLGFNTLGYSNNFDGRLSGFLDQELKIGNFYYGFFLITTSYIFYNFKSISFFYIFFGIFLIISFLIGERSNFIKIFFISLIFLLFMDRSFLLKKLAVIFTLLTLLASIIFVNNTYNERFYQTFLKLFIAERGVSSLQNVERTKEIKKFIGTNSSKNLFSLLKTSQYGAHYETAFQIFKNNIIFGVGIKNFRHESGKEEYINEEFQYNSTRQTTHPHQLHFELLSETGLFGYLCFFIFFTYFLFVSLKQQFFTKNLYQLSGILFLCSSFLPLLPSGSFFTTYGATIFWVNFAIIELFNIQNQK